MDILQILEQTSGLYLALAVVAITTLLILLILRSSKLGDRVLLLGLCDSGKTSLFSQLTAGVEIRTQTSILENEGKLLNSPESNNGKPWKIVDIPGHERVRAKYLYNHKDSARGVVFVIDSANFPREIRDVAEYMYDLLANRTMQKNKISILVACNKQDLTTAKSHNVIKTLLEKELNKLRQTRSAALLGIDDYTSSKNAFIGKQGKDFEFTHVHPIKVTFCECTLKSQQDDKTDSSQVRAWLEKL